MAPPPVRLVVAITGASGAVYGVRLLQALAEAGVETHLVLSRAATLTITQELEMTPAEVRALAGTVHGHGDVGASIASGSFRTAGMIIAPCSTSTLGAIAGGVTENLISRAADVVLKERRRLVLLVRESPLHLGHLRNMVRVTEMGAIVAPPVPAFYTRPRSLEEMVDHTVGRLLDLFDIDHALVRRWQGMAPGQG